MLSGRKIHKPSLLRRCRKPYTWQDSFTIALALISEDGPGDEGQGARLMTLTRVRYRAFHEVLILVI